MTTPRHETNPDPRELDHHPAGAPGPDGRSPHGGHGLMMLMCIPMLLIAGFLVVTGAGGAGLILAVVCVGMMAAMMVMMPGGHSHG